MKNIFILLIAAIGFAACKSNGAGKSVDSTKIEWLDPKTQDMGKVIQGKPVEIIYHFKNTGDHNLIISEVRPQCGCTVPEFPKEPIAPGAENQIKAVFNSASQGLGEHTKYVKVIANTDPAETELRFKVEVTDSTSK